MIHYHGGPITPETAALRVWTGRHAFVSWERPDQLHVAMGVCQSFALDNGAFSRWKRGGESAWDSYYEWSGRLLNHPACDWAVIPDVIGGTEDENDALIDEWPHGHRGVPVWHLNESTERLVRLASEWPRVALGSAAEWDVRRPLMCVQRLHDVLPAICDSNGWPITKLHGLRMLSSRITSRVPFASADSTNVARNIGIEKKWSGSYQPATKEGRAVVLVERVEATLAARGLDVVRKVDP